MNRIYVNPYHSVGHINRNIFGGFAEHLERCIYGGIYDPDSPLSNDKGLRADVLQALRRLKLSVVRYPGGNFASGYRWIDGVGPRKDRPTRLDMAWHALESNQFGTNEFIEFCHAIKAEPYLVVNCGDGNMREARDWVEYCNGKDSTALANLRRQHGYDTPHGVKYWGIGNEIDGPWQIGFKTPEEYARVAAEYAKVMKWVDPNIKLIANGVSNWRASDFVERCQLLIEHAGDLIDFLSMHWYVDNDADDFKTYMTLSELIGERLSGYEGLIRGMCLERGIRHSIDIAVDEWNVWHRKQMDQGGHDGVIYNLEDALVVAMHFNAFIRHAYSVKMANIAQIVNVIAPIRTKPDGMFLQTIFYPFELYSTLAGTTALNIYWTGDTFCTNDSAGLRVLDVTGTVNTEQKELALFVVNRSESEPAETIISLSDGRFNDTAKMFTVNADSIKAENSFDNPCQVTLRSSEFSTKGGATMQVEFEPHSITAIACAIT